MIIAGHPRYFAAAQVPASVLMICAAATSAASRKRTVCQLLLISDRY